VNDDEMEAQMEYWKQRAEAAEAELDVQKRANEWMRGQAAIYESRITVTEAERDEAKREFVQIPTTAQILRAEAAEARVAELEKDNKWLRILLGRWAEDYPDSVTDYDRAALAPSTTGGKSAWLIERGQAENHAPTVWWIAGPRPDSREGGYWTTDASEATKFASKAEAEAVVYRLFTRLSKQSARATEHMWCSAPSATGGDDE